MSNAQRKSRPALTGSVIFGISIVLIILLLVVVESVMKLTGINGE